MTVTHKEVGSLREVEVRIAEAVQQYDWPAVKRHAGDYSRLLRAADDLTPRTSALLKTLLKNLQYEAVMDVADAALAVAPGDRRVWRNYAQALVDRGRTAPALRIYAELAEDPAASAEDHAEASGGVGRCYKQLFLTATSGSRRADYLRRAVDVYTGLYNTDRRLRYWHGINAVALLAYADRNSMTIPGVPDPGSVAIELAKEVLTAVADADDAWAKVTACEANLALDEVDEALLQAREFCADSATDAFAIGAFLRQVLDVWQVTPSSALGTTLVPLLRAALVRRSGGSVVVGSADVAASRIEELGPGGRLEKVFGSDRYQTLRWWRTGLSRCRAVVRIDDAMRNGRGTGFLVKGSDLHPSLPEFVVMTNGHVVPEAVQPEDARVAFHGLDADEIQSTTSTVRRVWWYSPSSNPGLDTTLLEIDAIPAGLEPIPLVKNLPVLNDTSRAYIIGHPRGYDQPQFSIQDNLLIGHDATRLHYRAPTEGGSSGSPVFESDAWKVIGLHHAGSVTMARFDGQGTYEANEALRIDAIRTAIGTAFERDPP